MIALLALAFVGVTTFGLRALRPGPAKSPVAVNVDPVALLEELSLTGRVQARSAVAVPVPIDGKIDFFHVEVGQQVAQDQVLALIKSEVSETAQEAAQAAFDQVQTRLTNLEGAITAARLEASRARAEASRARSELERADKANARQRMLLSAGATPRLAAEKAAKEYEAALQESTTLSDLADKAEERVAAMQREAEALRKTVAEKAEDLEEAKTAVSAGEVRSPVDGVVTARRGSLGEDVDRSMTDLFQIATELSALEVVVEPPPAALRRIKQGQQAVVRVAELSGEGLAGVVKRVENGQAVVEFTSPLPEIKPGLTAQVTIKLT